MIPKLDIETTAFNWPLMTFGLNSIHPFRCLYQIAASFACTSQKTSNFYYAPLSQLLRHTSAQVVAFSYQRHVDGENFSLSISPNSLKQRLDIIVRYLRESIVTSALRVLRSINISTRFICSIHSIQLFLASIFPYETSKRPPSLLR